MGCEFMNKHWWSSMFEKDPARKIKKVKKKIKTNIYGDQEATQHIKKFHLIHYVFKYKYFMPLIRLGKKLIGKALVKKIPPHNCNRNIIIFDKAYEESIKKWNLLYLRNSGDPKNRKSYRKIMKEIKDPKSPSNQTLRDMKEMVNTMYLYDTAYREFMNILMHEIAHGMTNHYKDHPEGKTGHLFFTTDIYETNYYVLEKMMEYNVKLGVHDVSGEFAEYQKNVKGPKFKLKKRKLNSDDLTATGGIKDE